MNRKKILPIFMISIGAVLVLLIVTLVLLLNRTEWRQARLSRVTAVRNLLGKNSNEESISLDYVLNQISEPWMPGGSIDNLHHFLNKNPGRRSFARKSDRKRAEAYLSGEIENQISLYASKMLEGNEGEWVRVFPATVQALLWEIWEDVYIISGIPEKFTPLPVPVSQGNSVTMNAKEAIKDFTEQWIPPNETARTYSVNPNRVRQYLLGKWRFRQKLTNVDDAWEKLITSLYKISMNKNWKIAVTLFPILEEQINAIIEVAIGGNVHHRAHNLMEGISSGEDEFAPSYKPEIRWYPILSYYKNIPELTGTNSDNPPSLFYVKMEIGYTFRDKRTQTWVNSQKNWLTDYFLVYLSDMVYTDFYPEKQELAKNGPWNFSMMKARAMNDINNQIKREKGFGTGDFYGVRDVLFMSVNMIKNP